MNILYQHLREIADAEFVDLLKRSTLAERRPIDDPNCIKAMLKHTNLLCTAWDDFKLVGVARSITDFEYCCYLSDLAVDKEYQRIGIGKGLIRLTRSDSVIKQKSFCWQLLPQKFTTGILASSFTNQHGSCPLKAKRIHPGFKFLKPIENLPRGG